MLAGRTVTGALRAIEARAIAYDAAEQRERARRRRTDVRERVKIRAIARAIAEERGISLEAVLREIGVPP